MLVAVVVGVICVGASFAAAFGNARVISTALEGMARQPEVQGRLFTSMLIGVSLLEVIPIISIVIAFMLVPLISK
ncbi:MAG TPA: ATP synthase F0 subunit C [Bacillota bacterium]|nr:ATP synthase F0 subunit C [Bacillota bacterium]